MIPELKKGKDILAYLGEEINKGYDPKLLNLRIDVERRIHERLKRLVREGKH